MEESADNDDSSDGVVSEGLRYQYSPPTTHGGAELIATDKTPVSVYTTQHCRHYTTHSLRTTLDTHRVYNCVLYSHSSGHNIRPYGGGTDATVKESLTIPNVHK